MNRAFAAITAVAMLGTASVASAATTVNGTFAAALAGVTSNTVGIREGSVLSNASGFVTSSTGDLSTVAAMTTVNFSTVTATAGTNVSFTSSFGTFNGTVDTVSAMPAPNAVVDLTASGIFNPSGDFNEFLTGFGSLTLSFTQTGPLGPGSRQPAISGSFTFASGEAGGNPNPIPEPATWAMLLTGFGMVGATIRRRRQVAVAA